MRASPARAPRLVRVLTNSTWVDGVHLAGQPVTVVQLRGIPRWRQVLRCLAIWRYAAVLLNIEARGLFLACAMKKLLPFVRCPILSVDLILTRPTTRGEWLRFVVRRWLLKEVDRFVLYFRDTAELRRVYEIPPARISYVPFKVNTLDRVLETPVTDEGFFLACGRSNRDYETLCAAFRDLPYRCVVLAPWHEVAQHGTSAGELSYPPNVALVSDDGTPDSWNRWIARARCVVLPIIPGMLSPAGIGTYLVAMALGKPVIITESVATRGLLDERMAALVPPRDAERLRAAVLRVAEDAEYSEAIAAAGRSYAQSLGGEARLRRDLVEQLADLCGEPRTLLRAAVNGIGPMA